MPSVGMRRSTRVFGVVNGGDTARVLRSGRRMWPESVEGKTRRGDEGGAKKPEKNEERGVAMVRQRQRNRKAPSSNDGKNGRDRLFGVVYFRKRKRNNGGDGSSVLAKSGNDARKMFGLQFSRRQRRRSERRVLTVAVKPSSGDNGDWFSRFLFHVLSQFTRFSITLKELSAFLLSEPICSAYASRGIQVSQGSVTANVGVCQIFGMTQFMPLFSVDFSAVPLCFKYLHSAMLFKSMIRSCFLLYDPVPSDVEEENNLLDYQNELSISCNSCKREALESGTIIPKVVEISDGLSLVSSVRKSSRLASRNRQYKKCSQKKRVKSLKRKTQNPSSDGALASGSKRGREKILADVVSNKKLRTLSNSCTSVSLSEADAAMEDSKEGLDLSSCTANILIAEADRCYRVEGAVVTSEEGPSSGGWLLVVKKDGLTKCTVKAEKVMKSWYSNRYTHVRMFPLDNGWKLEFANQQDWIVFKNLYKECSSRNVLAPVKFIPVPGVHDVSGYADSCGVPFNRPSTYISVNGDELFRAINRKTANYDMDSEDEKWLSKFNNDFQEHVSGDNFELIIDAMEKAYYYNPDDCYDEKHVANWCQNRVSKEVVEAVHSYWMIKRKEKLKRSTLLRVFQRDESKRSQFIPKPHLRKKRSFKRQPSQLCRGNPSVLQVAAEKYAVELKNAKLRVEAAKASANKWKEIAIQKRKMAQLLMQKADWAMSKATMFVRAAEEVSAQAGGELVDTLARNFLD